MRRTIFAFILPACLISAAAAAQDDVITPEPTIAPRTTITEREVTRGYLRNESVGIKPQAGMLTYTDTAGTQSSRMIAGFTLDFNLVNMMSKDMGNWYLGPSTGFLFSHLGPTNANFFGTSPDSGSNFFLVPLNLKLAYNLTDYIRIGAHGGGNVVYRSVPSAMDLGASSTAGAPVANLFPNVGADVEFGLAKNVALMIRPDFTFTSGTSIFSATAALSFPLG